MNVLVAAGVVFLFSWWLTGRLSTTGSLLYWLDHPNERSLHQVPTPRTGGVAVLAGAVVGLGLIILTNRGDREIIVSFAHSSVIWILGAMFVLAGVSFCDDRWGLPTGLRFGVQLAVVVALVAGSGIALQSVWLPFGNHLELGWLAGPVTVVFLLWMTNLYNFMDGMDGFAGGMTVLGFGIMAYLFWSAHQWAPSVMALVQAAAALGFLQHNFPPAKIFMGDVGSIPTGFLAGSLAVLGCHERVFDLWVPLLVFSPFILDATATLVRRAMRGERIWQAHREHYYQRVVLAGWSHRRTVAVEYAVMICCGSLALMYQVSADGQRIVILGAWMTLFLVLAGLVHRLQVNRGH